MVVLITGGAKSGKSTFAEKYAAKLGTKGIYIATSPVFDEELQERVRLHQQRRDMSAIGWETIEESYELNAVLRDLAGNKELWETGTVVLVDCLILWLSNWLLRYEQDRAVERIDEQLTLLEQTLRNFPGTLLLVSNEVGYGIVPDYPLGRNFRDLAGIMNQRMAAVSDRVFLVTAGIPIELKSREFTI
ncbi:bifunctional adenosylcobinamide kinase/adenosylcobinamide-phosphate guanylyltransferase [Brevibacillus choshinensis]|uniref:bifunctional adenosylcobinamide kinase/adenosylcobinamide-phosphate guanylyltransferase n=1 Tax=Brevibacillus choshinensis TaxID=54911 RepID=UPI002E1E9B18|nr:bifunctional adenosylcobinamide kinase/adenosylcobinamide-phosphate guanylyltransferase [Brevibacillus choshinensis]MED4752204.1 bifunctional adenosylcobinamide kinase/adenosylcobinamide-phosphate guanylyltransferase [Brevibacillus choshinensis]